MLLEGAAGVALAGLLATERQFAGKNVVAIVCGGNISRETLKRVL
jgi:threonine dehydratase